MPLMSHGKPRHGPRTHAPSNGMSAHVPRPGGRTDRVRRESAPVTLTVSPLKVGGQNGGKDHEGARAKANEQNPAREGERARAAGAEGQRRVSGEAQGTGVINRTGGGSGTDHAGPIRAAAPPGAGSEPGPGDQTERREIPAGSRSGRKVHGLERKGSCLRGRPQGSQV